MRGETVVDAVQGQGSATPMGAESFKEQFENWFDFSTGGRKLTCMSRARIPERSELTKHPASQRYKG